MGDGAHFWVWLVITKHLDNSYIIMMDYEVLKNEIFDFRNLKVDVIGRSEDDRDIYSLSAFFGAKKPWVIFQGSIHAREHLATDFVIFLAKLIEKNWKEYKNKQYMPNICFVPMANPDGVEIVHHGVSVVRNRELKNALETIIMGKDFRFFKANARGVDLNNNFDAMWGRHKNSLVPSFSGFVGKNPFSERETRALCDITQKLEPIFTMSFHLKGEEIYYDFFQHGARRDRDKRIARMVAKMNGYKVKSTEKSSSGGFKDWCVQALKIPSLTVELGRDSVDHPVPQSEICDIIAKNIGILDVLCDIVRLIGRYKNGKYARKVHESCAFGGKKGICGRRSSDWCNHCC